MHTLGQFVEGTLDKSQIIFSEIVGTVTLSSSEQSSPKAGAVPKKAAMRG